MAYHSPTRNPIEAKKATMPTMVEKWQALESMLRTHTSCPRFCIKNHPEEEMQPKTIMEKNCKRKTLNSISNLVKLTFLVVAMQIHENFLYQFDMLQFRIRKSICIFKGAFNY